MDNKDFLITPRTKVADLLKNYPHLEEILIEIAPAFKKLRNPVLRRTVAKVTSLAQAARVGNLPVTELVGRLRLAAGQPEFHADTPLVESGAEQPPDWFDRSRVVQTLDARPMIDAGEQPLGAVFRALEKLGENEIYELITPFEPAPLIDKAREHNYQVWCTFADSEYRTYFSRINLPH